MIETDILLQGIIEIHVHTGPDIVPRKLTDFELARKMKAHHCKALVLKSHFLPTFDRAKIASEETGFPVFGGVVLNESVGGFYPKMVELALEMGGKTIWMPTQDAANHVQKVNGKHGGLYAATGRCINKNLDTILRIIAEHDAILETGHLSAEEIFMVVERAKELGVRKIVVDHPEAPIIHMPEAMQIKLIKDYNVYMCRCSVYFDLHRAYMANLKMMRTIGIKNTILSTDAGNINLPDWDDLMIEQLSFYLNNGITKEELSIMTKENPSKILGLKM